MESNLKQVIGIDIAQKELVCTFGVIKSDLTIGLNAHKVFKNSEQGFSTARAAPIFNMDQAKCYTRSLLTGCYGSYGGLSSKNHTFFS